jgi:hypothetical protein
MRMGAGLGRAFAVFSAIEGAQLVARGGDDVPVFDSTLGDGKRRPVRRLGMAEKQLLFV